MTKRRSLTGFMPPYSSARKYLEILDGTSMTQFREMCDKIDQYRGSPQRNSNWKDPDRWIPNRLKGRSRKLAERLWKESICAINPAHLKGYISLCAVHSLMSVHEDRVMLTKAGIDFLAEDFEFIAKMDAYEGILMILAAVADSGPGTSRELSGRYWRFCKSSTGFQSDVSIFTSHTQRLKNMVNRNLVVENGRIYSISAAGNSYLGLTKRFGPNATGRK